MDPFAVKGIQLHLVYPFGCSRTGHIPENIQDKVENSTSF